MRQLSFIETEGGVEVKMQGSVEKIAGHVSNAMMDSVPITGTVLIAASFYLHLHGKDELAERIMEEVVKLSAKSEPV